MPAAGNDFDLAIAGSGFGGSLLAAAARSIGLRVLLVERGTHPRFAIGESTSPLANLVLEEIAREFDLPDLLPLTTYGTWKGRYPAVGCGLKRGFTFHHHTAGRQPDPSDVARTLMVAASPSDRVSDMHWLRSDVDHLFLDQAVRNGAEYTDRTIIESVAIHGTGVRIRAKTRERDWEASASVIVDATGPRGLLARQLQPGESPWPFFPKVAALFSHFEGLPFPDPPPGPLPYPAEWAAVHHVFDGGWMWSLRFDDGIASIGLAAEPWLAEELKLAEGATAWDRLLRRYSGLEAYREAKPIRKFDHIPQMAYRCSAAAGERWAMLPGAAAFVDPFLSTGIPMTLLGIQRLGRVLKRCSPGGTLQGDQFSKEARGYERQTFLEVDTAARLVAGSYLAFPQMELLSPYLMYYFAAASFAEVCRRLGEADRAAGFLRAEDERFQRDLGRSGMRLAAFRAANRPASVSEVEAFTSEVRRAIERVNAAGLLDSSRRGRYPVEMQDVVAGAGLFGRTEAEMRDFVALLPV